MFLMMGAAGNRRSRRQRFRTGTMTQDVVINPRASDAYRILVAEFTNIG